MGLFDRFKKKDSDPAATSSAAVSKWADRAADKRAQAYDRHEAIAALSDIKTADAAAALLRRFNFSVDPSITDQEEKELAFSGIIACGEQAIEPVREFAVKVESLAWPIRIFKSLLETDSYVEELLGLLAKWDTEYTKFIDPKLQILAALEEEQHPQIRPAVERFVEDVNETARFHGVGVLFKQGDPAAASVLLRTLVDEESFRVKNKIAQGFALCGWEVPADVAANVDRALPQGFRLAGGKVVRVG